MGSSNLTDLETPRGVEEQESSGATAVVLTSFGKDPEAGLEGVYLELFLVWRGKVQQKEQSPDLLFCFNSAPPRLSGRDYKMPLFL